MFRNATLLNELIIFEGSTWLDRFFSDPFFILQTYIFTPTTLPDMTSSFFNSKSFFFNLKKNDNP